MRHRVPGWGAILTALVASGADSPPLRSHGAELRERDDWPMWGGRPDRNMVSNEKNLPTVWSWDPDPKRNVPKKNIRWIADLGTTTYGNPVVSGGRVFIGTNNDTPRDPAIRGDRGVLMCFSAGDGKFLWQAVHEKLYPQDSRKAIAEDNPDIGICSTPCVVGDRVYYVSNRAELVCRAARDGKAVWLLDMRKELGILPHQGSASSPLVVGDLVFVVTGQGRSYLTQKVENPKAPSFVAVDRATGKVVWQDSSPGDRILTGQWGSPGYGVVDGTPQVAFPGGDGWLYAFEPATGKPLWKFNCKAHEKVGADGQPETTNQIFATPVYFDDRVFIAVGEHPDVGGGPPGCLRAIDARKRGDITKDGEVWRLSGANFEGSLSTVAIEGRHVYTAELSGYLNCIDLASGRLIWRCDLLSSMFGSPLVADRKVYVRDGDGEVWVFAAGKELKLLARNTLPGLSNGTVVAADGVLYIAGMSKLYAIAHDK